MDIRQLNAFVAVFEERNITSAAQRLFTSQPTLSVTIRQLEEALGTILFERLPRGVDVTDDARTLYPQARRLLAEAQALSSQFRQRNDRLTLEIGVEGEIAASHLDTFLRIAYGVVPNLMLTLHDGCSGDARLSVEDDCCEDELFMPLWEEPYVLSMGAGHPLAARDRLDAADLATVQWITCPTHPSHQRLMELYNRSSGFIAATAGSLNLALRLVAAGAGLAMLPQSMASKDTGVVTRPARTPNLSRRVGLCYAAQALDMPALRLLHAHLQGKPLETTAL
ncbi:LysR family transcriptional regulator [Pseudomonas sp. NFR16]|uniref:LysR family transcriptional regulator n=1 Tax=Pseudomonas sp. NFR16 TaxID=1566248 RepID=UPI0008D3A677|nr:LysR family transcriptional regulator [Pseudomonas sp. NFR16]SEJ86466.1 transcriptional regulator, LysR family [Pseudomonas sp. NFR16]